jgi:hypothetical protein
MSAIGSLGSIINPGGQPQPQRPYLIPLNPQDDTLLSSNKTYFQYWPEEITDNKQSNWETKNIPGLSHPIYQWISGGGRELAFTAIFTRDRVLTPTEKAALENSEQGLTLFNNNGGLNFTGNFNVIQFDPYNVDIPSALAWLRQFIYPNYGGNSNTGARSKPPAKLILGLPGMRINPHPSYYLHADEMVCFMTQCDVNINGFFNDGTPRIAKVALQFTETMQYQGRVQPTDAIDLANVSTLGYVNKVSPGDKNRT